MRKTLWMISVLMAATLTAQTQLALPGCEAAPEVRKTMDEKLDYYVLEKFTYSERMQVQRQILEDLMARYPREIAPYMSYARFLQQNDLGEYKKLRERWVQAAKEHGDDPLWLALAGSVLKGKDTPEAIRLLELAKTKANGSAFPWADYYLVLIYTNSEGKFGNKEKMVAGLESYFGACPSSTDRWAQWILNKDEKLQPKVAAALRARLATESDPKRLQDYATLWGLEFRTHPPKEHDAVRAQVAEDLKRLTTLHPDGDAKWLNLLVSGYKQSGASEATLTAAEDRLLKEYPHSRQAESIVYERWTKAHPKPEDETDKAAWAKWKKEYVAEQKLQLEEFTDDLRSERYGWFYANSEYGDDLAEDEGVAIVDNFLKNQRLYEQPSQLGNDFTYAAQYLIEKKWQPKRALELLKEAKELTAKSRAEEEVNDTLTEAGIKQAAEYRMSEDADLNGSILQAAALAHEPEEALKLKAEIEGPVPSTKKLQSDYWLNRGRLAAIEKHTQDALAYYQLALFTRESEPKAYAGKVEDDLRDEAQALWKQQGGSEAAFALWSKPSGATEVVKEGRWEKATKKVPDFELSDLSGKTWKLKDLHGKVVLINLWATWCGPCQVELPHLEKLYEKVKDRTDVQILTFDIDEELGQVAPFVKKKGFSFPVLPAYSTVVSLLDGYAIPQMWLIDANGVWQSTQVGFGGGSEADFEKDMLDRVDALKATAGK